MIEDRSKKEKFVFLQRQLEDFAERMTTFMVF